MTSLPYPINRQDNHGRVGMAGMPYPPTDCHSYIKLNINTYLYITPYPDESSRRKTKQFSSYFRFPTSHTTVRAVPHTAVPILDTIRDTLPLK